MPLAINGTAVGIDMSSLTAYDILKPNFGISSCWFNGKLKILDAKVIKQKIKMLKMFSVNVNVINKISNIILNEVVKLAAKVVAGTGILT